jgi:5-methylcytosine-specific restriction enzyme subunit McrC
MLLYAWEAERPISRREVLAEDSPAMDALLAKLLADLLESRLRRGLGRDYEQSTNEIRGIRGRINFARSARRQLFERGRAMCTFPEFTDDVWRNRIIKATLSRVVSLGQFGLEHPEVRNLRQRLRRLVRTLRTVSDIEPHMRLIRHEPLRHDNADYGLMLNICALLLQRLMPSENVAYGARVGLDRDELILYDIFEKFIARFYRVHATQWNVRSQYRMEWFAVQASQRLPGMIVDVELVNRVNGKRMLLDSKFTAASLESTQHGPEKYSSGHLYQMYTYLRTQERLSPEHLAATGILLYPSVGQTLRDSIKLFDHSIKLFSVDLSRPWKEIERELLDLLVMGAG